MIQKKTFVVLWSILMVGVLAAWIFTVGWAARVENKNAESSFTIDPNSELVTNLNLLYDPNFYTVDKFVRWQFCFSDVNGVDEATSTIRKLYGNDSNAKEVIDIEVCIGDETHTASFEDFFEWMGFKR